MATQKQIDANRRNAEKSTGPRTEEGREISRANSTRHGLSSNTVIHAPVRSENPGNFADMRAEMICCWAPEGIKELQLVEMLASAYVRMQRCDATEAAYMDGAMATIQLRNGAQAAPTGNDALGSGLALGEKDSKLTWELLDRYRRNAWLDYDRTVRRLEAMQKARRDQAERDRDEPLREARREEQLAARRAASDARAVVFLTKQVSSEELASFRTRKDSPVVVPLNCRLKHDRNGNMTGEVLPQDPMQEETAA